MPTGSVLPAHDMQLDEAAATTSNFTHVESKRQRNLSSLTYLCGAQAKRSTFHK